MKNPAGKPYADTRLVAFLKRRVLELRPRKSQAEIATESGFSSVNMLAMIKSGASRMPLDRVPALAKALDVDPALLLKLAVEQQDSALGIAIDQIFGTTVTRNELTWLEAIREASGHSDPHLTAKAQRAIRDIFGR